MNIVMITKNSKFKLFLLFKNKVYGMDEGTARWNNSQIVGGITPVQIYTKFDIAILLPLIAEQTSLSLVEFLSVGVPVIYNENADMPFVDGICGVMIPSNTPDPQILRNAIEKVLGNYVEYSRNAIEVVFKYYNVEKNARELFTKV